MGAGPHLLDINPTTHSLLAKQSFNPRATDHSSIHTGAQERAHASKANPGQFKQVTTEMTLGNALLGACKAAARLVLLPSMAPGSLDGVMKNGCNRHGTHPSGNRSHCCCHLQNTIFFHNHSCCSSLQKITILFFSAFTCFVSRLLTNSE